MDDPAQTAVKLSLEGKWSEAVKLNQEILKKDPSNIEALCRLGRALSNVGKIKEASAAYQKVLRFDPINNIARKNIDKLKHVKSDTQPAAEKPLQDNGSFLEEPGKTKTVPLIKLASPTILIHLSPGDKVSLVPRQHSISVSLPSGTTLGRLPDDLSARLIALIKGGNSYSATVRSVSGNSVRVMIKELKRGKKFINTPSFPGNDHGSYVTYVPPQLVHEEELEPTTPVEQSSDEE